MTGEPEVTVEVKQENKPDAKPAGKKTGESVGQVIGGIVDTLEVALTKRGNTVMVRVNDDALANLDMLVEAGICKSRSESAAFLLQRGIDSSASMQTVEEYPAADARRLLEQGWDAATRPADLSQTSRGKSRCADRAPSSSTLIIFSLPSSRASRR